MAPNSKIDADPDYGHRLLTSLVDQNAVEKLDETLYVIPNSPDFRDGVRNITYKIFANAVNRAAWWLESKLGRGKDFETISYLAPCDVRYPIIIFAANKVGYKTLLPSPRNSLEGQLSLLEKTDCHYMFSASKAAVEHILAERAMEHITIPDLEQWLDEDLAAIYPYDKTFENAQHEPVVILHTSGSTGLPKPIVWTHAGMASSDAQGLLPTFNGFESQVQLWKGSRIFCGFPPFHAAGMLFGVLYPIFHSYSIYWPPADRPMSVEVVENFLENVGVDICYVPPSILGEISESESSLRKLKDLKYVGFSGGPLPYSAGERILRYARIVNTIGSTEMGLQPLYQMDPEDWMYFHLNHEVQFVQFRDVGEDLYEMIIVHHPSTDIFTMTWHTFPNSEEYPTKDLFMKHPTKPNIWRYIGRSDDIIVLSNGEKIQAKAMEEELYGEKEVRDALVVGQGRFQPAVIFEMKATPPSSDDEKEQIIERLLPYIEKANKKAPAHGRITRDHITFAKPEKPFLRAAKGTVQRFATVKAYEREIDQLYAESYDLNSSEITYVNPKDTSLMINSLSEFLFKATGGKDVEPDQDFFFAGVDSLGIMDFVRQLKRSFTVHKTGVSPSLITARLVYANPTISKLAAVLHAVASQNDEGGNISEQARIQRINKMLEKYSSNLQRPAPMSVRRPQEKVTVILTGSTGSLGSYLLEALLALPSIIKVHCLNRGADSQKRQEEASRSRGLSTNWKGKVEFLQAAMGQPHLGLSEADYERLRTNVTYIIHNQWQVDFNLSLPSFELHVARVRNLVDFSLASSSRPPILFTSSISTVSNWPSKHPGSRVPEEAIHNESVTGAMGYAESKHVGERLLDKASQIAGVDVDICRVGQIAGPVQNTAGAWNKQEWLPTIIASSKFLGKLPSSLGSFDAIDWIPVDILSNVVIDLMQSLLSAQNSTPLTMFHHLTNPKRTSWSSLLSTIVEHLSTPDFKVQVVPLTEWLMALQDSAATTKPEDINRNPGLKLIDFYEAMAKGKDEEGVWLETKETEKESESLRSLQGVGEEWMKMWLRQWNF